MALTPEQVQALYAKRRTRGAYAEILAEALANSDENGFAVKATFPQFAEKPATTLYQGFRNAADKLKISDNVDILNSDDEVFVIFKDRVSLVQNAA